MIITSGTVADLQHGSAPPALEALTSEIHFAFQLIPKHFQLVGQLAVGKCGPAAADHSL